MSHICVSKLDNYWLDKKHHPSQCRLVVNWTMRNKIYSNLNWNTNMSFQGKAFKMLSANCLSFYFGLNVLSQWGRVTHICISKLTNIGSDNGLVPGRHQAITWTNAALLSIGPLWTNFSEIWIKIQKFSFLKMHLKMSSGNWRPFCPGLNVLSYCLHCYQPPHPRMMDK